MRSGFFLSFPVICAVSFISCKGNAKRPEPIVLTVNDRTITRRDFDRKLAPRLASRGNPPVGSQGYDIEVQQLLREQIDELILLEEARRRSIMLEPGEADAVVEGLLGRYEDQELEREMSRRYQSIEQWRESVALRLLLDRTSASISAGVEPVTEDEVLERFSSNPERYQKPEQISVSQILVRTESDASDVLYLLRKKGVPFEHVARERSIAPEAAKGGLMGVFAVGELPPEIEEPIRALTPGSLSDIVRTSYGYHVFRLNRIDPPHAAELSEVRDIIAGEMKSAREQAVLNQWLDTQRRNARIQIADDLLHEAPAPRK